MKARKKRVGFTNSRILYLILILLILVLIALNYNSLDTALENLLAQSREVQVERVVDGDTIQVSGQAESVRLLGINTPERGEYLYNNSKAFLESEILNENVTLKFVGERYDKYGRMLAYIIADGENINIKMVENGLANYYFYSGRDKYSSELEEAWDKCLINNMNLCEKSIDVCVPCIKLSGSLIINSCTTSCNITNWSVRGEGREKFIFSQQTLAAGSSTNFALDLSNTGGSLFLRDDEGKLVEWKP